MTKQDQLVMKKLSTLFNTIDKEIDITRLDTDDTDYLIDMAGQCGLTMDIVTGRTKIVFYFPLLNSTHIYKVPLQGGWDENLETFYYFEEAGVSDKDIPPWNYCAKEKEIYESAKLCQLNSFLVETKFLGFLENELKIPVYKQLQVEPYDYNLPPVADAKINCLQATYPIIYWKENDATQWWYDFLNHYGSTAFSAFCSFAENVGIMADLHGGNLGYDYKGNPIVFDYGGFAE